MKSKILKFVASILLVSLVPLTACGKSENDSVENGKLPVETNVQFWGAYSTDKIMQDNITDYESIKKPAEINLRVIGGEEESYQIIMTSGNNKVDYNVLLNNLKNENDIVFDKENIKVYHERYIEMPAPSEYYTKPGFYPDVLVPFENARKLGENRFSAKSNQGLYISFEIPEEQQTGIYKGTIDIETNGKINEIPVSLNVADVSIGAETHSSTIFLNRWNFARGEKDGSDEMYQAYNKALFDRRLGCDIVTIYHEDVDLYAEKVCEYAKDIKCPTYTIPWFKTNYKDSGYVLNGRLLNAEISYDTDKLQQYFKTIAYKGLEENVDPFKKGVIYGYDEPDLNLGVAKATIYVKEWAYIVKQSKNLVIEALRADKSIKNQELLGIMIESIRNVPHIVLSSNFLNFEYVPEEEDIVYCPEFQFIQNQGAQDQYRLRDDNQLWWYGCINPSYPHPSYHLADTVISARVENWMRADYNIKGNLYWATNFWQIKSPTPEVVIYPEDYYGSDMVRIGDGILFYPGARYGIYGPIPSLRIEQIRDGMEEYEMIYKLSHLYKERSKKLGEDFDEKAIMKFLYSNLYSGTMVSSTSDNFEIQRRRLINLLEMANSSANVCIKNVTIGAGTYNFAIYTSKGTELKQSGKVLHPIKELNDGCIYNVEIKIAAGNKLDLSVLKEGKNYNFELDLGNESSSYNAEYLSKNNRITGRDGGVTVETKLLDGKTVNKKALSTEKYLQIKLGNSTNTTQAFLIKDENVIGNLGQNDDKLILRMFNGGTDKVSVKVYFEYASNPGRYNNFANIDLYPGVEPITINNLSSIKWEKIGKINSICVMIGEKGDPVRDNVYLIDMTIYK